MTQPTALFLADILEDACKPADIAEKCAKELRRLHAQRDALLEALEDMLGWQSLAPQTIQESAKGRAAALRAALADGDKAAPTEPVQEPVAHLWQHSETGRTRIVMPDQIITMDAGWLVVGPLYLAPPQRKPLTDDQLDDIAVAARTGNLYDLHIAIERAHGIE